MNFKINLDIKEGTVVFVIINHKIEQFFVEDIVMLPNIDDSIMNKDISHKIELYLERYNNKTDSFKTTERLSNCYLTKEELIKNL